MKELLDIVAAFEMLCAAGKPAALATVIGVEGSSYRRPGARMLVTEDGRTWGGVSGGCLERDVAARARGVIATGRAIICRYDTGDDEVPSIGASTGCGGAVELLIQPISADRPGPLPMLTRVIKTRQPISIATVIRAARDLSGSDGTCLAVDEDHTTSSTGSTSKLIREAARGACGAEPDNHRPQTVKLETATGSAELFVEHLYPPQALVIFGAGPDAAPLVSIAKTLGWHVTVVGTRPATGIGERFPKADALRITASDDPAAGVEIPSDCAVVVMTHNIDRDQAVLERLPQSLRYLGILGPRHRTEKMLADLPDSTVFAGAFYPMGLDLGAQSPEEIALSVVAEIQAVVNNAPGRSLRERSGPIHPRAEDESAAGALTGGEPKDSAGTSEKSVASGQVCAL